MWCFLLLLTEKWHYCNSLIRNTVWEPFLSVIHYGYSRFNAENKSLSRRIMIAKWANYLIATALLPSSPFCWSVSKQKEISFIMFLAADIHITANYPGGNGRCKWIVGLYSNVSCGKLFLCLGRANSREWDSNRVKLPPEIPQSTVAIKNRGLRPV